MDIVDKEQFVFWMQRALGSHADGSHTDDNYIELYNILLRSFTVADSDYDGQVSFEEFHNMIEAAGALPRKFGFNWWSEDKINSDADKLKVCEDFFKQIDENNDGSVAFEEWLSFALDHYTSKSNELPKAFDQLDKESFVSACKVGGKDVYWFMWKCFQSADVDRDGLVSQEEFDKMLVMATENIRRVGLPDPFPSPEDRAKVFSAIDENGDGSLSADEWLQFCRQEIVGKVE